MTPSEKQELAQVAKGAGDVTSIGVAMAALVEIVPALAALASLIWACIRIYETETVQRLLKRRRKE